MDDDRETLSMVGVNGSAFKLLARAHKQLRNSERPLFDLEVEAEKIVATGTDNVPARIWENLMLVVSRRFRLVWR